MANLIYLTLNGEKQGLISAGCCSLDSVGNKAVTITGWISPITANVIASSYNGGGDSKYAEKLSYVHTLLTSTTGNTNQ